MCIDFTDLNKSCPKDCNPLSSIDQKVESIARHEVLSFLDLSRGYHHALMDPVDATKTTFITEWRVFAYKKMPYGLKNAGATYQRLVDRVFKEQIGNNMEVYVDDLLLSLVMKEIFIVTSEKHLRKFGKSD